MVQRKCACSQPITAGGECEQCRKKRLLLQRWDKNRVEPAIRSELQAIPGQAPGGPLVSRFGHDFSRVQLRTQQPMMQRFSRNEALLATENLESQVAEAASTTEPAETTTEPATPAAVTGPMPGVTPTPAEEPATESETSAEPAAPGLIVEDEAIAIGPDQMRKSEFLTELRTAICAAAEAALAGTGRNTEGCPYLDYWFNYYSQQDAAHGERALRRYAPEARTAPSARGYIPIVAERVRQGVARWARTGEISGVPEGVPTAVPGEPPPAEGSPGGTIQRKAKAGAGRQDTDPAAIRNQLGHGRPLDSDVRARMETAFGTSFSHVRLHNDSHAAGLSSNLNARAFTVGEHVAFGAGEYQPGTMLGDALIAHELAHVVQQRGASNSVANMQVGDVGYDALEKDADRTAVAAIASLWVTSGEVLRNVAQNAVPGLRSGLRLQRCNDEKKTTPASKAATPTPTGSGIQIKSQTVSPDPSDRGRSKLGVGEEVVCTTDPSTTVTWSVTGGGAVSPVTGTNTTFTASKSPSTPSVNATVGGSTYSKNFTVVAPASITSAKKSEPGLGTKGPPNNKIGAYTIYDITVLPTDVSFYGVKVRENIPKHEWTWPNGTKGGIAAQQPAWSTDYKNKTIDNIKSGPYPINNIHNGTNYVDFNYIVKWQEEYENEAGKWVEFVKKETTNTEYRGADQQARQTHMGAPGEWQGPWK